MFNGFFQCEIISEIIILHSYESE